MHIFKVEKNKMFIGYFEAKTWTIAQKMAAYSDDGNWMDYNAIALSRKQKAVIEDKDVIQG